MGTFCTHHAIDRAFCTIFIYIRTRLLASYRVRSFKYRQIVFPSLIETCIARLAPYVSIIVNLWYFYSTVEKGIRRALKFIRRQGEPVLASCTCLNSITALAARNLILTWLASVKVIRPSVSRLASITECLVVVP